jgi:hypothetical protein
MAGKELVLIKGTPGIGKSLFLRRFLVYINEVSVNKGGNFPLIYFYKKDLNTIIKYSLLENGDVFQIEGVPKVFPDYLLSDSVDLNAANGKVLSIEVASDKPDNYNKFSKRIQEVASKILGKVFVMPLFDFEELKCLYPEDDSKLLRLLNEIVGGSARNLNWILGECDEKSEFHVAKNDQISSKLIEVTDWYFENFEHETYLKFRKSILNAIKKNCRMMLIILLVWLIVSFCIGSMIWNKNGLQNSLKS